MATNSTHVLEKHGALDRLDIAIVSGIFENEISGMPKLTLEFSSRNKMLDLGTFVGADMGFVISDSADFEKQHPFWGTCISAEFKGLVDSDGHYIIEISPWLWFLSRATNNRIFQNMTTTEIVQEVLGEYNFGGNLRNTHSGVGKSREYCVQYRETDLAFLMRLLAEEGIYFYFDFSNKSAEMVLADDPGTHPALAGESDLFFAAKRGLRKPDHVLTWELAQRAVTGKVTLDDYDFTKPDAHLDVVAQINSGENSHNGYETYHYPGGYKEVSVGQNLANYQMEAAAAAHKIWQGRTNAVQATVAGTFQLKDHPRVGEADDTTFMITKSRFLFREASREGAEDVSFLQSEKLFDFPPGQLVTCTFEAVDKSVPYRVARTTPKPLMTGVQTAVVTGPAGEEVYTDEYGRIKVQFHWDRMGKHDDKTSCWLRTMMPWTGANWGMINVPRIGQEVVVQFEEGDPDRPICVGMLYNANTMPPYALPDNATRSGVKTNSSKGGDGYNELMFEDKKGAELVRFFAEKDYVQNIENSAHIKVGYVHPSDVKEAAAQDARSMKLEVENHLDEIIEKGDHLFEVQAGKQTIKVKKNKSETIDGASTRSVYGDVSETVTNGDVSQIIKKGDVSREVSMGNDDTILQMGNYSIKTSMGAVVIDAMQSITLKVGPSEIKLDMSGVTIQGPIVTVKGSACVQVKGGTMTEINSGGVMVVKGAMTMIN